MEVKKMCKETDFEKCGACPYIGHSCCNRSEKNFDVAEAQLIVTNELKTGNHYKIDNMEFDFKLVAIDELTGDKSGQIYYFFRPNGALNLIRIKGEELKNHEFRIIE